MNAPIKKPPVDPMLAEVLATLGDTPTGVLAARSGLARSTIENWKAGRTRHPQSISLQFALRAAGFRLKIVRD